jgi:succinate dehydrogenase / fumarate reductase, membrane anchor subunit
MRFAFTGLAAWWVQRASAVCLLLFLLFAIGSFSLAPVHSYPQWRAWVARPGVTIAILAFFVALLPHMWVGLRDVLLDYAKPANLRRSLLAAVALGLLGLGAWVLSILLRLQG